MKKTVTVEGGNVYTVGEMGGSYYVRRGGRFGTDIAKVRSFDDALAIIKSHSGKSIRSIG